MKPLQKFCNLLQNCYYYCCLAAEKLAVVVLLNPRESVKSAATVRVAEGIFFNSLTILCLEVLLGDRCRLSNLRQLPRDILGCGAIRSFITDVKVFLSKI